MPAYSKTLTSAKSSFPSLQLSLHLMPAEAESKAARARNSVQLSWFAAVAMSAAVTLSLLALHADDTMAAIIYLVLVVCFSTVAETRISILLAVTSSLLFDYFFLPPFHSLSLNEDSWLNLVAFIASCLVVGRVAERARRQTERAEQRRYDVECLNRLSQEMMLHGDAERLVQDIPRLVEQVFELDAALLYVSGEDQTYSSLPGESRAGKFLSLRLSASQASEQSDGQPVRESRRTEGTGSADLVFGMKTVGTLVWRPAKLAPEVATSVAAQVAIAITRAHAIEVSARLQASRSAERLRSALMDSLTHELRTPLTAIRAASATLLDGRGLDEGSRTELIVILDEETSRLDNLISEAMQMAEIESNQIKIHPQIVAIESFLEDTVAELRSQLRSHSVQIVMEDAIAEACFDSHLVGRVMHHLLENAARYTPPGSRITVRASRVNGGLSLCVEDDGPGIDAHDLPLIFEKFYRGGHRAIVDQGSGMGLAICRSILAAHEGTIEVDNIPGSGARFCFWLPAPLASQSTSGDFDNELLGAESASYSGDDQLRKR